MAPPQKKARTGEPKSWLAALSIPAFDTPTEDATCKCSSTSKKTSKKTDAPRPLRRVRIDGQNVRVIMNSTQYMGRDCRKDLWYSNAELKGIRQEMDRDCSAIREHQQQHNDVTGLLLPPDTVTFTSRGIEHVAVVPLSLERDASMATHVRLMLEEQNSQHTQFLSRNQGAAGLNPERLAVMSAGLSATFGGQALLRGDSDEASGITKKRRNSHL